jgi:hypothetical protein
MKGPKGFTRFLTLAGVYLKDPHTRLRLLSAVKEYAHNKGHLIKGFQGDLRTLVSLIKDWNRGIYTDVSKKTSSTHKSVVQRLPFHKGLADRTSYDDSRDTRGIFSHMHHIVE